MAINPGNQGAKPSTPSGPIDLSTLPDRAIADLKQAFDRMAYHDSGGQWAMAVLAFLLTAYVWYAYGAQAGAPLAASTFICFAMIM